jgi:hypothetical protein
MNMPGRVSANLDRRYFHHFYQYLKIEFVIDSECYYLKIDQAELYIRIITSPAYA